MNATTEKCYAVGERVRGVYHGQSYVGTVDYARPHTMKQSYMHHIVLDEPITVFSTSRDRIIVSVWEPQESHNTINPI